VHVPRTRSRTNLAIPNQNLVDTAPASGSHAHATNTATMPAPNHPGNHGTPLAVEDDGNGYVCIYISLTSYPFPNNNLFMLYILMRYYYLYFTLEKKILFTYIKYAQGL
jgi:hypothetical protein